MAKILVHDYCEWVNTTLLRRLWILLSDCLKVSFFRKCDVFFKSPKKYSKLLSWVWNLKSCKVLLATNSNFQFRIVIWNIFLEIWQTHRTFWKKATFSFCCRPTPPQISLSMRHFLYFTVSFNCGSVEKNDILIPATNEIRPRNCVDTFFHS